MQILDLKFFVERTKNNGKVDSKYIYINLKNYIIKYKYTNN